MYASQLSVLLIKGRNKRNENQEKVEKEVFKVSHRREAPVRGAADEICDIYTVVKKNECQ